MNVRSLALTVRRETGAAGRFARRLNRRQRGPHRLHHGLLAAIVLLASGCGYRVGTLLPPSIQTIHVPLFTNATDEPRLEVEVTNAVIQRIQEDGTLSVADAASADIVVEGKIISYRRDPLRYERDNPAATEEYRLRIAVQMTVRDRRSDTVISSHSWIEGDADFEVGGDLKTAERRVVPIAAQDLARDVVERIVEGW